MVVWYYNLIYLGDIPDRPEDFELVFTYGYSMGSILDTGKGTFTKDMILDPDITIQLTLSEDELNTIWAYLHRNHFYELGTQRGSLAESASPIEKYTLFVHAEGYPDREVSRYKLPGFNLSDHRFFTIANKIKEIIEDKPEYKVLPKPRG